MEGKKPSVRPDIGKFLGFDHVVFYVGNAKQAASYYTTRLGFEYYAYKGLETGERDVVSHVVKRNNVLFEFQSSYDPQDKHGIGKSVLTHGDGVHDIAFTVEDCEKTFNAAKQRGAKVVRELQKLEDENGHVLVASILTYGDTIHTLVQRNHFKGIFLPGYKKHYLSEPFNQLLKPIEFEHIDHIVGNHGAGDMEPTAQWYEKYLSFHRFWSVDDTILHTEYSALNSIVVADFDEVIKMPQNEPAKGKKKSQIQEYVDYYNGSGVQHIALRTNDILRDIERLRERGVEFLAVPDTYYDSLRKRIPDMKVPIKEDIELLQKNRILVDYDDKGYLLQIFTKPLEDRPTLFFEVIQRHNHNGFGAGNFKSLFKAIEEEQEKRGNLV